MLAADDADFADQFRTAKASIHLPLSLSASSTFNINAHR